MNKFMDWCNDPVARTGLCIEHLIGFAIELAVCALKSNAVGQASN
jgi:hypothetical protein